MTGKPPCDCSSGRKCVDCMEKEGILKPRPPEKFYGYYDFWACKFVGFID